MEQYRIKAGDRTYPMGLHIVPEGLHVCTAAEGEHCRLLLFKDGEMEPSQIISFPQEFRRGNVFSMTVSLDDISGLSYCFDIDGIHFSDPYGRSFLGREVWGDLERAQDIFLCPIKERDFDWEGDTLPCIPYEDSIIYRMHCRGFTKHSSSGVKWKGTFQGILEKIPYLKDLGVTTVELLPVNEFQEVILPEVVQGNPFGVDKPTGKINYWGYGPGFYFSPKVSYSSLENDPGRELKNLVKALHKEGLELMTELYFTGKEPASFVLDVVRFWAEEFHLDGIHLTGFLPLELLRNDPYLSKIKLLAHSWEEKIEGKDKHLADCNDDFLVDMRRVLKGDEDQMKHLAFRMRNNPSDRAVINYMASTNGFTMMDMVSYDTKHNEGNGEKNQDGNPYNHSWNCGMEGPTRKKAVVERRKKQLRNAFLLLFLSQGTPLIMAGDEFGHSQSGNNNAYCQDNEVTWLNWNLVKKNQDLLDFVKALIAFRKSHPVFRMSKEPRLMDYLACGLPDLSYHGVRTWCPEFENFRRQLGVFYCGAYGAKADGTRDENFYVIFNMHWEPHKFDLPSLKEGKSWHIVFHTDEIERNSMYGFGEEPQVEGRNFLVPPRTIVVFIGK
jgi:glycogen operon protein